MTVKAEIETRTAQRDRLAAYFKAHVGEAVQPADLERAVGLNYRSRISECRAELGMVIENVPQFLADGKRGYGAYRFRGEVLGREASTFVPGNADEGTLFDLHPRY